MSAEPRHPSDAPSVTDLVRHGVLARLSWAAASSALARGDREAFARHAAEAALHVAATGDLDGAAAFAHLRGGLLELLTDAEGPVAAFAESIRRGAAPGDSARAELAVWWRFQRALATELPATHPLIELAADGWDSAALDVVLALLVAGEPGATAATLAGWTGRSLAAVELAIDPGGAMVAAGVLGRRDDAAVVNPVLWAACAGVRSPLELRPAGATTAGPSDDAAAEPSPVDAAAEERGGVVVMIAPTRALARAELRSMQPPPIVAPDAELGALWAARDARWRGRPLVLELSGTPGPEAIEVLLTAPDVIVLAEPGDAAWLAANVDVARTVRVQTVQPLTPATASARLAQALGLPPSSVRAGHLFAGDVDALIEAIDERGEAAVWALAAALRERATAALGALALDDTTADLGPGLAPGLGPRLATTLERTRELLAGQAAWTAPPTAVLIPGPGEGELATRVAIELARERGAAAAAVDLDGASAWKHVTTALDVLRRHGGVLAVRGIDRAPAVCVHALAYALPRAQVTTVIGVAPGAEVPATLRKVSAALPPSAARNTFP